MFLVPRGTNSERLYISFRRSILLITFILYAQYRPHDRVPLKEMKADWHSCLDNRVGFKVRTLLSVPKKFLM